MHTSVKAFNLPRAKFISVFLFGNLFLATIAGCSDADLTQRKTVTVLADDQIYQERSNPETLWYGVLEEAQREGAPTPDQRNGLYYQLVSESEINLLYTKKINQQLEGLLGRNVVVRGKFIMPPDDVAVSEELWPATVQLNDSTIQQEISGVLSCASDDRQPEDKLHPMLERWLNERSIEGTEQLVVTFCENLQIPENPDAEEVRELREPTYALLIDELKEYNARVLHTFWLVNGIVVEMPLQAVPELAKRPDVQYIEPEEDGSTPP